MTLPPPQPTSVILPHLLPVTLDPSSSVRRQLLKLFRALPEHDIPDHVGQILPYVRAGMTHLAADVRVSAVEILSWLLGDSSAADEMVSCPGGWVKTLNCFLSVLGWHTEESAKWSASRGSFGKAAAAAGGGSGSGSATVRVLAALAAFLHAGLDCPDTGGSDVDPEDDDGGRNPHWIPQSATPYAYLNLFGQPRDQDGEMYETSEDRRRVFANRFQAAVQRGLENARREGGEIGRAAAVKNFPLITYS